MTTKTHPHKHNWIVSGEITEAQFQKLVQGQCGTCGHKEKRTAEQWLEVFAACVREELRKERRTIPNWLEAVN